MSSSADSRALETVVRAAAQQLAFVRDALARPDVDREGALRTAFTLLLSSLRPVVAIAAGEGSAPPLRAQAAELLSALEAFARESKRVGDHLVELSHGWRCPACRADVASAVSLSNVRAGLRAARAELVCARCGQRSELTEQGHAVLLSAFGSLEGPAWRPDRSGFVWDGT